MKNKLILILAAIAILFVISCFVSRCATGAVTHSLKENDTTEVAKDL